jgi:hypothetical protein
MSSLRHANEGIVAMATTTSTPMRRRSRPDSWSAPGSAQHVAAKRRMRTVRLALAGLSVAVLLGGCGGSSGNPGSVAAKSTGSVTTESMGSVIAAKKLLERTGAQAYVGHNHVNRVSCAPAGGVRYSCRMYFSFSNNGRRGYREALVSVKCPRGRCHADWSTAGTAVVSGPGPASTTASGSQAHQQASGTTIGHDYVRIYEAFVKRPGTVPSIDAAVGNFNSWSAGKAHGEDISEDVNAAGFTSDPAPTQPLSPSASAAAAAVVIPYLEHTSSPKYGPLTDGYLIAFRHQKFEFRCKAKGNPPSDLCKGSGWARWEAGFGAAP